MPLAASVTALLSVVIMMVPMSISSSLTPMIAANFRPFLAGLAFCLLQTNSKGHHYEVMVTSCVCSGTPPCLTYEIEFVLFLAVLEKSVLPLG